MHIVEYSIAAGSIILAAIVGHHVWLEWAKVRFLREIERNDKRLRAVLG